MNDPRPTVFAPQEPMRKDPAGHWVSKGLNLAAAAEYGILTFVWTPDASVLSKSTVDGRALEAARKYNDETDWIVALGSPTLIAAFAHAVGALGKELRILEWDKANQRYVPTVGPTL